MSEKQRASVETFPEHQENSLLKNHNFLEDYIKLSKSKVEPNQPTSAQFESWKNSKEFAIWLDGKNVPNSELDNYSLKDIVHFSESKVYKNARTAKFPQPFQSSLYTKEGFRKTYEEADVTKYRKLTKTYSEAIGKYLKGPQTDNSELKILKAQADKIYNSFTKEELEKHNILPFPPVPAQKKGKADKNEILNYTKKYKRYESLRTTEPHYIHKSADIQKEMDELFSDLGGLYFRMSKENKAKVKRPISRIQPYVQITLNGKTYYKKRSELTAEEIATLPPPPPPAKQKTSKGGPNPNDTQSIYNPSFLEFIIEMENEGASFYLDDEKISTEEAKAIAANNKGKRTDILTQLDANGKYVVKLSNRKNNVSPNKDVYKNTEDQDKPTDEEVSAYNAWAKQLKKETLAAQENERNGKIANYPIVKQKDLIKYVGIYKRMTSTQKENSVELPIADDELKTTGLKFPPPPPPTKVNQSFTYTNDKGEIIEVVEDPQPEKQETILPMINAKTITSGKLSLTRNEIKDIMLSTKNGKVTEFKLKIPGQPTQHIKSNVLDIDALKHLESAKKDDQLVLFALKDGSDSEIAPLVIIITD